MSDNTEANPQAKSPFWRFSVTFYAVPEVAPACIQLQDRAGVDVNILFFLLWNAKQGRTFTEAGVRDVEDQIAPWREMAVVPLRAVRRALRAPPPAIAASVAEVFRNRIKAAELEAERLQQETLYELSQSGRLAGTPAPSPEAAARGSVVAYQAVLRPFPPEALETVLGALASFDWPARDRPDIA